MKTIHKYSISCAQRTAIKLPIHARILDIQLQRGEIVMWAEGAPDAPLIDRVILCLMTGQKYEDSLLSGIKHLATVQSDGGLVYHFFEEQPNENR